MRWIVLGTLAVLLAGCGGSGENPKPTAAASPVFTDTLIDQRAGWPEPSLAEAADALCLLEEERPTVVFPTTNQQVLQIYEADYAGAREVRVPPALEDAKRVMLQALVASIDALRQLPGDEAFTWEAFEKVFQPALIGVEMSDEAFNALTAAGCEGFS